MQSRLCAACSLSAGKLYSGASEQFSLELDSNKCNVLCINDETFHKAKKHNFNQKYGVFAVSSSPPYPV
jgi:hypothetical protein